jgi:hypothetical protein
VAATDLWSGKSDRRGGTVERITDRVPPGSGRMARSACGSATLKPLLASRTNRLRRDVGGIRHNHRLRPRTSEDS